MPGCCVDLCKNRTEKGARLFRLPTGKRNSERRLEWLRLIGKNTLPERALICEAHFGEDQFENKREDGRKLLRPFAKPNLLEKHTIEAKNQLTEKASRSVEIEIYDKQNPININCTSLCNDINSHNNDEDNSNNMTNNIGTNVVDESQNTPLIKKKDKDIRKLKKALEQKIRECNILKKKLRKRNINFEKVFNADQQKFMTNYNHRGSLWSAQTINKALKLYVACGRKGYEEVQRQNLPYPSIRTLQYRIQSLKFGPGILEDILQLLKMKIETFKSEEKHAILLIDEMSIKPGLQYDRSTNTIVGRPTIKLSGGMDSSNQLATHSMVFMLCGITTNWKQTIGYEYTANSFCPQEMTRKILTIIEKAHNIGLIIKVVLSDMGAQNRSWWRLFNITAGKCSEIKNNIQHPCNNEDKLFITPDPVHVFKNTACALTAGNTFYLDETIVKKYNLPHNEVSIKPIREVYMLDQKDTLKLCPHLKEKSINPSHFDKMNVALSVGLLNNNVAAAILYHIDRKNIDYVHKTTAWFISTIHKWFKLMTSRYEKLALSHFQENIYTENITFLKEFNEIVYGITVVGNGKWKPFQSGLVHCTQTALDIQHEYLNKQNLKYLLLGRFTQDALENLFSTIRGRTSVPDAREFKQSLRLVSLSQFQANINRGNYSAVDTDHLVQYCTEIKLLENKNKSRDIQCLESIENEIWDDWDEELHTPLMRNEPLNNETQTALYYLTGALLHKIKKNYKHCTTCFNALVNTDTNSNDVNNNNLSLFTKLREYKKNVLYFPTMDVYNIIYKCEILFRQYETDLLSNKLKPIELVNKCLQTYSTDFIPACHNIIYKLLKIFVISRIHFVLKTNCDNLIKAIPSSSRSVAMKKSVINYKCYGKNKTICDKNK